MMKPYCEMDAIFLKYTGGTCLAIAGEDFALIAADTLLFAGDHVRNKNQSYLFQLTPTAILGCGGKLNHVLSFTESLTEEISLYRSNNHKTISIDHLINVISLSMYRKCSNPFITSTSLAGLDADGRGVACSFDVYGHDKPAQYCAVGVCSRMMAPILDTEIGLKNGDIPKAEQKVTVERAVNKTVEIFNTVAKRHVFVGGSVEVKVITKDGIDFKKFPID